MERGILKLQKYGHKSFKNFPVKKCYQVKALDKIFHWVYSYQYMDQMCCSHIFSWKFGELVKYALVKSKAS
jgi:hypothetical protein